MSQTSIKEIPIGIKSGAGRPDEGRFERTKLTWLNYLMLGYYAYLLNGLGPLIAFLIAELGLSYTLGSLHSSAFALGAIVAGLVGPTVTRWRGRRFVFWLGGAGMATGAALLVVSPNLVLTISSAFVMGSLGSLMLITIPAALSEQYGPLRTVALTEANMIASVGGWLAPILIGLIARTALGWRGAVGLIVLVFIGLAFSFRQVKFKAALPATSELQPKAARLPKTYWVYWVVQVLVVAVEFSLILWSSDYLHKAVGLSQADAALVSSVFLLAMLVGRLAGSRLARRMAEQLMLLMALGVATAGFLIYWLVPTPWLTVTGLLIAGLGVANLYPFTLSLEMQASRGQNDAASARASLASGSAILAAPFVLGWLADQIGLQAAHGIVLFFLVAAVLTVMVASRLPQNQEARS